MKIDIWIYESNLEILKNKLLSSNTPVDLLTYFNSKTSVEHTPIVYWLTPPSQLSNHHICVHLSVDEYTFLKDNNIIRKF